jgi:hypothetical protein
VKDRVPSWREAEAKLACTIICRNSLQNACRALVVKFIRKIVSTPSMTWLKIKIRGLVDGLWDCKVTSTLELKLSGSTGDGLRESFPS